MLILSDLNYRHKCTEINSFKLRIECLKNLHDELWETKQYGLNVVE